MDCTICLNPPMGAQKLYDWHGHKICMMCQPVSRVIDRMHEDGVLSIISKPFDSRTEEHKVRTAEAARKRKGPLKKAGGRKVVRIKRRA